MRPIRRHYPAAPNISRVGVDVVELTEPPEKSNSYLSGVRVYEVQIPPMSEVEDDVGVAGAHDPRGHDIRASKHAQRVRPFQDMVDEGLIRLGPHSVPRVACDLGDG